MRTLQSPRLTVRAFCGADLADYRLMLAEAFGACPDDAQITQRLQFFALADPMFSGLGQPCYGDRAICDTAAGTLIGSIGLVPCLAPFSQLPAFGGRVGAYTPELGLFWALRTAWRRRGIATEAARLMMDEILSQMGAARIVATTEHDNLASIAVMRRCGMTIERNVLPTPGWFQTVGFQTREGWQQEQSSAASGNS